MMATMMKEEDILNGKDFFCSYKGVVVGNGGPFNSDGESVTGEFDGAVTQIWEQVRECAELWTN